MAHDGGTEIVVDDQKKYEVCKALKSVVGCRWGPQKHPA